MTYRLTRLVALDIALDYAAQGVREVGGNNRGPVVQMIQRADSLPGEIYAWCQSTMNAFWRLATGGAVKDGDIVGGAMLAGGTASVGLFAAYAKQKGWVATRPFRGYHFCLQLTSDNWPDHVGQIVRVLQETSTAWLCETVEGNTGDSSIDDGDGIFVKQRWLSKARTIFIAVPGETQVDIADELRKRTGFYSWVAWRLGEGDWKPYGPLNAKVRPAVPANIVLRRPTWFPRLSAFLAARSRNR